MATTSKLAIAANVDTNGAIDADGHVLEPLDTLADYLEDKYKGRALKLTVVDDGLEYFLWDNKISRLCSGGFAGVLGAMGDPDILPSPERNYERGCPPASYDAAARVERLDGEGLSKAILYPTLGLLWEAEIEDPALAAAYCRSYNRWIVDMCGEAPGRLYPIAHISLSDVDLAVAELERAVKAGCRGAMVAPYTWTRKAHGHPYYDSFWAKAQELDVPVGLHPSFEPTRFSHHQRFDELKQAEPLDFSFYFDVLVVHSMQQAFVSLFNYGVFEKFPKLKVVVLESQAGWIGYLLDRMDAVWDGPLAATTELKEKPSYYFRRQCWISADPDERALTHLIEYVGADKFFWASDFPHPDHTDDYIDSLKGLLAPLSVGTQNKVMRENVAHVYKLN
ncbi:MAG: amidohydrolase family protein [Pseudomonadota bacterium]|nr:amidohydrolase family protein [Pseudomonadota bacterium]